MSAVPSRVDAIIKEKRREQVAPKATNLRLTPYFMPFRTPKFILPYPKASIIIDKDFSVLLSVPRGIGPRREKETGRTPLRRKQRKRRPRREKRALPAEHFSPMLAALSSRLPAPALAEGGGKKGGRSGQRFFVVLSSIKYINGRTLTEAQRGHVQCLIGLSLAWYTQAAR
jgi:hypothetical protein